MAGGSSDGANLGLEELEAMADSDASGPEAAEIDDSIEEMDDAAEEMLAEEVPKKGKKGTKKGKAGTPVPTPPKDDVIPSVQRWVLGGGGL